MVALPLLIEAHADFNAKTKHGDTALHLLIKNRSRTLGECAELLLLGKAAINTPNDTGLTPVDMAKKYCMNGLAQWLPYKHAQFNNDTSQQDTRNDTEEK
jgi:hypothetical protein